MLDNQPGQFVLVGQLLQNRLGRRRGALGCLFDDPQAKFVVKDGLQLFGGAQVESFAGNLVRFLLQFSHALGKFLAVLAQRAGTDQSAPLFHPGQHRDQRQVDVPVDRFQFAGVFQLRGKSLVQAQSDVSVFGGVGPRSFQIDLVEGQLLGAFARNRFVGDGFFIKIGSGQAVHVVAGADRIQHVGLHHGVLGDALQLYVMVGQHVFVVLEVLPDLFVFRVFEQRLQLFQHRVTVQLLRRAHIIMAQWHVSGLSRLNGKRNADNFGIHVAEAGGFGVEGEQIGIFEFLQPLVQVRLLGNDLILLFHRRFRLWLAALGAVV